ncbi:MAG: ATP-binding protein [Anaerolineae bacterium]
MLETKTTYGLDYRDEADLAEEEASRLALQSLLLVAACHVVLALHVLAGRPWDGALTISILLFVPLLGLSYWLSRKRLAFASAVLVSGFIGTIALLASVLGTPVVWIFLVLPVLMSGALLGPGVALLFGAPAGALAHFLNPDQATRLAYAALPFLTGLVTWVAYCPKHSSLQRSLRRSRQATALAEQLRDERGKLNRTIKALDDSYQLLEKTNRELQWARQEADMLRDLRSRFATNLSHELRTPLNIILGFSQLICTKPQIYGYSKWSETLLRDLAEIRRNAGYLAQLVDDIVDLARVDALAMPVHREPTDLCQLVEEAAATVSGPAADKGLAVTARCPSDTPPLLLDPLRIRQVLYNLLTNAIRHTSSGSVTVSVQAAGDEIITSVADTGCGIPQEELDTIFNEFHQVGRPRESGESGKGLGLAIAKRFVQLHGGRIWVESEMGKGSVCSFALPLHEKSVALARQPGAMPLPKQREKPLVLVLDDDGTASHYLKRRLDGYEFLPMPAPDDLTEATLNRRPVAVIANRRARHDDPPTWQSLLDRLPEDVPLLECALPSNEWLFGGEQFAAVLTKPVASENLLDVVTRILNGNDSARVVVVDDDRGFVQLIARILQTAIGKHYKVVTAYSGQEALRKIRRAQPQLVLLDLRLPDLSGCAVLEQLRQDASLRALPVVAVTAATPGEDQQAVEGAFFILAKRGLFRPGELVGLIATALAAGQSSAAAADSAPTPPVTPLARPAS